MAGISGPVPRADAGTVAAHVRALGASAGLRGELDTYVSMTRALVALLQDARLLDERRATELLAALLQ